MEDPFIPKSKSGLERFDCNLQKYRSNASLQPRTNTVLLSTAEVRGIRQALEEVEKQKKELEQVEGLSQFTFFAGIVNVVMTTFVFAKYPQSTWLFYGIECAFLIPAWWYEMTVKMKGFFFMFDFCWFTSAVFGIYMALSYFSMVPVEWQRSAFLVFYSCGLGPMSWACIILHSGMVFHSLDKSASLFIHYTPVLVTYALIHNSDAVAEAWPGRFPTVAELSPQSVATYPTGPVPSWFFYIDEIYLHGWRFYMAWWFLHGLWLLTIGVYLPQKGFNTVFGNIYERANLGEILSKKTGLKDIRSHAAIYLAVHWAGSSFAFFWPTAVFRNGFNIPTHAVWIVVVFLSAVWNGAGHYDFIFAKKYTKVIQTLLDEKV
eukprot:CAMPEP_0117515710 /NCGR_PEP_ID=MMETSP0784-20121206/30719_1 /TAXON_ID=39447 /ORGANISM="" /LENGTH=374 /DNA_ID=CAMNT_0005311533 /DNA_START=35 /DNA_END=1159 /DNA_ORIENTATION=-